MANPNTFEEVRAISTIVLQVVIAIAMFWRHLHQDARFFFTYILWQTVSVTVLYAFFHFQLGYHFFYGYWMNNVVCIILGMAIIFELFNRMFDSYKMVRRFAKLVLLVSAAVLVAIGAIVSILSHTAGTTRELTAYLVAERSLRIIQFGLIAALLGLTRYLRLQWKNYLFGIALGFGFYAFVALTGLRLLVYYGQSIVHIEGAIQSTAYCAAVGIWTFYVLQVEAVSVPIIVLPSHELEKWDQALRRILAR